MKHFINELSLTDSAFIFPTKTKQTLILVEGDLYIEGENDHTLRIRNDEKQALVFDFNSRQSLLYFIASLPSEYNLLKSRKSVTRYLQFLDQDLIVNVGERTAIYKKANVEKLMYNDDLVTALSILWFYLKRSIRLPS